MYLDTNIFLNVIYKETKFESGSSELLRTVQQGRASAVTSAVTTLELVLDMSQRGFPALADEALSAIEDLQSLTIVPLDQQMARGAAKYVLEEGLTVHDAYHLSTALSVQSDYFVSRDASLIKKIKKYFRVASPEEILSLPGLFPGKK